jgi:hypothetical protein
VASHLGRNSAEYPEAIRQTPPYFFARATKEASYKTGDISMETIPEGRMFVASVKDFFNLVLIPPVFLVYNFFFLLFSVSSSR